MREGSTVPVVLDIVPHLRDPIFNSLSSMTVDLAIGRAFLFSGCRYRNAMRKEVDAKQTVRGFVPQ
jgi:hypothetical protein